MTWPALHGYAQKCLSTQQVAALDHQRDLYDRATLLELFRNKTVQEVLDDDRKWPTTMKSAAAIVEQGRGIEPSPTPTSISAENAQPKEPGPWVLPYTVQFILRDHRAGPKDPEDMRPEATSFIMAIPDEKGASQHLLLITARHVVEPSWEDCQGSTSKTDPATLMVRLNKRGGGTGFLGLGLKNAAGAKLYFVPDDDGADLAVVPLSGYDLTKYLVLPVPVKQIATDAEMAHIDIGASVMTAGLQPDLAGDASNTPISKNGTLSDKRAEPIEVPCRDPLHRRKIHAWIVQAPFTAGLSGAPVFSLANRDSKRTPILIGIQSAEWPEAGLSGITPSSFIATVLRKAVQNYTDKPL